MPSLPNLLTLVRILLVVPVVACVFGGAWGAALMLFTVAALTDFLDGWIARRWKLESDLGRFLDPLADKLMVAAALVALVAANRVAGALTWAVVAILMREIAVSGLREWLGPKGRVVHVSALAKWKTATQLVAVGVLIAAPAAAAAFGPQSSPAALTVAGGTLLVLAALLSWASAWGYFRGAAQAVGQA